MESRHSEPLNLLLAVLGAAVLGSQSLNIGFGAAAIGDVAILLALFTFDTAPPRSGAQSLGFAGASAFCLLSPFQLLANGLSPTTAGERSPWMALAVWLIATLLLFAVDRFRVSSGQTVSIGSVGFNAVPPPAPVRARTVETPFPMADALPEPIRDRPPVVAPSPIPEPVIPPVSPAGATVVGDVTQIPPGREAVIYLNLVGEGLNVLRTVRAENLGREYYRIADVMPEGEQWEFTPGQVVRCRKKSLSNGKHMVAYEEAPRAQ